MQIRSHINGVQCDTGWIKRGENLNFFSYYFWNVMFYFQPDATNCLGKRIMGRVRYVGECLKGLADFTGFYQTWYHIICNKNKVSNSDLEQRSNM